MRVGVGMRVDTQEFEECGKRGIAGFEGGRGEDRGRFEEVTGWTVQD